MTAQIVENSAVTGLRAHFACCSYSSGDIAMQCATSITSPFGMSCSVKTPGKHNIHILSGSARVLAGLTSLVRATARL